MKIIEELYMEYKKDIYYYLLSLTHDSALSEDLLSETFVKVIFSIGSFKGESTVKTWLFGIARHLWLQHLRKERSTVEYNDLLELYVLDQTMDQIITEQIAKRINELLQLKDERTKKVVGMRINGISYCEISEKVGISENSARVIDFRTKKWIKAVLEKEGFI